MTDPIAVVGNALIADLKVLDALSQNVTNASTPGYKAIQMNLAPIAVEDSGDKAKLGVDVMHVKDGRALIQRDFSPGNIKKTGRSLDVAIQSEGFFLVNTPSGIRLTRNGSFHVNTNHQLVTAQGYTLLGKRGEIEVSSGPVTINTTGEVLQEGQVIDQFQLVKAKNNHQLTYEGDSLYKGSVVSLGDEMPLIQQGYLENSNVKTSTEMVKMMEISRHFSASQKALAAYDQMLNTGINSLGN